MVGADPYPSGMSPRVALGEVLRRSARYLSRHGVESPDSTAEALLIHVLATDRAGLYSRGEGLSMAEAKAFGRALCQRCTGTPLQYLTGEQQFLGLRLEAAPGVFVPRPETEIVVEHALEVLGPATDPVVVDVGTGTGAIALAVKAARPDARVVATDVSPQAVSLARRNAGRLGLKVEVVEGHLLDGFPPELRGAVALMVSNPPYVAREDYEELPAEVKAEPYEALVGGTTFHRRLAELAPSWLAPGGWLVVETGSDQGPEVRAILERVLDDVQVLPDMAGRDRVVRGRLP
jgi:release factor glutamine methyltransferase